MSPQRLMFTVGGESGPAYSLHMGHVDAKTFNKAFLKEWDSDPIEAKDLRHEWWTKDRLGWRKADKDAPAAQPVTVLDW